MAHGLKICALALGTSAFTAVALDAGHASAVIVNVGGTDYDVSTFEGSYDNNVSRFTTTEMPWWENQSLAQTFATAVGTQLGLPIFGTRGPFFGYEQFIRSIAGEDISLVHHYSYDTIANPPVFLGQTDSSTSWHYATASVASPPPAPVPGPLPLMGAAAAFGWSRKLRRHISPLSSR